MKFKIDDKVVITRDIPNVLSAGTVGSVWAIYATNPPSYEVTFFESTDEEISIYLYRDELEPL